MSAPARTQGKPCSPSCPFNNSVTSSAATSTIPAIFRVSTTDAMSHPARLSLDVVNTDMDRVVTPLTPASFAALVPLPDAGDFGSRPYLSDGQNFNAATEVAEEMEPEAEDEKFDQQIAYHPLFAVPDADVVLRSAEGTLYRVYAFTLRNTCGLFRTLFTLPQTPDAEGAPIPVFEPDALLCPLLCLLHGMPLPESFFSSGTSTPFPTQNASASQSTLSPNASSSRISENSLPWTPPPQPSPLGVSLSTLSSLILLAEKWDAPGPLAILRPLLLSPVLLTGPPSWASDASHANSAPSTLSESYPPGAAAFEIYALACHFGWTDVATFASTYTLSLDLLSSSSPYMPSATSDAQPTLYAIPPLSSKHLLALLSLHRARRDAFKALLDAPERFTAGNADPYHCARCGVTKLDNTTWRTLKARCVEEMENGAGAEGIIPTGDMALRYPQRESVLLGSPPASGSADGLGLMSVKPTVDASTGNASLSTGKQDHQTGRGNIGLEAWAETAAAWDASCPRPGCGARNYDRVATLRQIRHCIDGLVGEVELA